MLSTSSPYAGPPLGMTADIEQLRSRLVGPLCIPGEPSYELECAGFQTAVRHRPSIVVGAAVAADVEAAVGFAAEREMPIAVQGTGHGMARPAADGMLISTRRMTGVTIDPIRRTASIAAGAPWRAVVEAAARYGLAPLCGSDLNVGAMSFTLGGGVSLMARRFGYAADHVRSIDVVGLDGRTRSVTWGSDPELFWALRGGRSNFGVVSKLELSLFDVRRILGGGLYFPVDSAADVLGAYREWSRSLPDEMTSSWAMVPFPDVPSLPPPIRGRHIVHVRIAHVGDQRAGRRLIEPLRSAGPTLLDTVRDMPCTDIGSIHHDPTEPLSYYSSTRMLRDISDHDQRRLLAAAATRGETHCVVELRHLGGALDRPPSVPNAVTRRHAQFLLNVVSRLGSGGEAPARAVHARILDAIETVQVGNNVNFLTNGYVTVDDVRDAYGAADYERLARLKAINDPANLLRINHNIPPTTVVGATASRGTT